MKAAFATWNDRIAPLFDTSRQAHIVEVLSGCVFKEHRECFQDQTPVGKVLCLVEWDVTTLVCGAISRPLHVIVTAHGIQVISFVAGNLVEVMNAWLEDRIHETGYAMPGYGHRVGGGGAQGSDPANNPHGKGGGKNDW
jgi:predicted Fe-Mo cluster-binding NifX family protein